MKAKDELEKKQRELVMEKKRLMEQHREDEIQSMIEKLTKKQKISED